MAKKSLNLGKILSLVAAVLGVVAIVMIFVDTIKTPEVLGESEAFSGLKVAFGYEEEEIEIFKFSFMGLLPYLLTLAGVVLTVLNALAKKSNKIFDFVSVVAFVVAGILFFCMPSFVSFADTFVGEFAAEIDYKLAVGAVVAAISAIASGAVLLVKTLLKK